MIPMYAKKRLKAARLNYGTPGRMTALPRTGSISRAALIYRGSRYLRTFSKLVI